MYFSITYYSSGACLPQTGGLSSCQVIVLLYIEMTMLSQTIPEFLAFIQPPSSQPGGAAILASDPDLRSLLEEDQVLLCVLSFLPSNTYYLPAD